MNKEQAYLHMLQATANMQWNIAAILEAKALEAEKVRNWLINHMTSAAYTEDEEQFEDSLQLHGQIVETIEGITKLGQGLNNVLKSVSQDSAESNMGGLGGMLGGSFDLGDET